MDICPSPGSLSSVTPETEVPPCDGITKDEVEGASQEKETQEEDTEMAIEGVENVDPTIDKLDTVDNSVRGTAAPVCEVACV